MSAVFSLRFGQPTLYVSLVFLIGALIYFVRWGNTARYTNLSTRAWLLCLFVVTPICGLALFAFLLYAHHHGMPNKSIDRWIDIVVIAVCVFGLTIKEFWQYHRRWAFWTEIGLLVIAHFTLLQGLQWNLMTSPWAIAVVALPEFAAVFLVLTLTFRGRITLGGSA